MLNQKALAKEMAINRILISMLLISILGIYRALGQEEEIAEPIRSEETFGFSMHLVADPTIAKSALEYHLDNSDKIFEVLFFAPMDRQSVEDFVRAELKSLQQNPIDGPVGLRFDWKSDTLLHLTVPGFLRYFSISFDKAKAQDGRSIKTDYNSRMTCTASPAQTIVRTNLAGKILKEFNIPNERLTFGGFSPNGLYAIAYRSMSHDDGSVYYPYLLDLSGDAMRKKKLSRNALDCDAWDPLSGRVALYSSYNIQLGLMRFRPPEDLLREKNLASYPGGPKDSFLLQNPLATIGFRFSPSGRRYALVQTDIVEKQRGERLWPVFLVVANRDGYLLLKVELPLYTGSYESDLFPFPLNPDWQGEDHIIVAGLAVSDSNSPKQRVLRVSVKDGKHEVLLENAGGHAVIGDIFIGQAWLPGDGAMRYDHTVMRNLATGDSLTSAVFPSMSNAISRNAGSDHIAFSAVGAGPVYLYDTKTAQVATATTGTLLAAGPDFLWVLRTDE